MFNLMLLQIPVDSAAQVIPDTLSTPEVQDFSIWYLIKEGGPLMIPLAICSILAVYVFIERYLAISQSGKQPKNFMNTVKEYVLSGDISKAKNYAKEYGSALPKMIFKGLNRIGKPIEHIEKSMENEGKIEVYKMERNLNVLSTIAGIAPMFGFLGTIAGMIILFFNIQQKGFEIQNIAGGIYTKMMTSAVGLIIGMIAYIAYQFLNAKINRVVHKMESASNELLDALHEPIKLK